MYKILLLLTVAILSGCANIQQTIYLQNAEVNGPLNHPPIYISDSNKGITVSPWLSYNTNNQVTGKKNHSKVNVDGVFQVDTIREGGQIYFGQSNANNYDYSKNNVKWNQPEVKTGVDVDLPLSKTISLFGSFNYTSQNLYQIIGGSFGFGFYSVKKSDAIRLNIGCTIQQYQYDATTVVVSTIDPVFGKEYTRVDFFHDIDKKGNLNFFGNLTYNTVSTDMPINFFFSLAFFSQTILDVQPENPNRDLYPFGYTTISVDKTGEISTSYFSFSPGIYVNVTPTMRLVLGVNIVKGLGEFNSTTDSFTTGLFFMPLAKMDLMF
jgi:hypothetical protein